MVSSHLPIMSPSWYKSESMLRGGLRAFGQKILDGIFISMLEFVHGIVNVYVGQLPIGFDLQ